jgi:hypothetical protein
MKKATFIFLQLNIILIFKRKKKQIWLWDIKYTVELVVICGLCLKIQLNEKSYIEN